jgi:hypothetical protein
MPRRRREPVLIRLGLVVVILGVAAVVTVAYRRRRDRDERLGAVDGASGHARWPDLPADLTTGATSMWVIFTTPLCVSCDAVRADLLAHDPAGHVVTIDATERPELADRYGVRRAPTTILADPSGRVTERLVGPEAVRAHLRDPGRAVATG